MKVFLNCPKNESEHFKEIYSFCNTVDKMVLDNHNLIYTVLYNNFPTYMMTDEAEELYAEALIGLWTAAKRFNPNKGYKFSTYAVNSIYNRCRTYCNTIEKRLKMQSQSIDDYVDGKQYPLRNAIVDTKSSTKFSIIELNLKDLYYNKFSNNQQYIFSQMYNGLSQNKIAKNLGISQPKVKRELIKMKHIIKNEK